jgi:hypothetical protein
LTGRIPHNSIDQVWLIASLLDGRKISANTEITCPIGFSSLIGCSFILEEAINPESAKDSVRYRSGCTRRAPCARSRTATDVWQQQVGCLNRLLTLMEAEWAQWLSPLAARARLLRNPLGAAVGRCLDVIASDDWLDLTDQSRHYFRQFVQGG